MENLAKALAKAQGEIRNASKDKLNPAFKGSKYADLASIWDACRGPLSSNGLSVVQFPVPGPYNKDNFVGLRTVLLHESGESIQDTFYMPVKDMTNAQAVGSALTYARRYSLAAAVGIAPDDDDDGNGATGRASVAGPARMPVQLLVAGRERDMAGLKALWGSLKLDPNATSEEKDAVAALITSLKAEETTKEGDK